MDLKPITPEEFERRMKDIKETYYERYGNKELAHRFADYLMTDVLNSLGYSEGILINESMMKWYA